MRVTPATLYPARSMDCWQCNHFCKEVIFRLYTKRSHVRRWNMRSLSKWEELKLATVAFGVPPISLLAFTCGHGSPYGQTLAVVRETKEPSSFAADDLMLVLWTDDQTALAADQVLEQEQ